MRFSGFRVGSDESPAIAVVWFRGSPRTHRLGHPWTTRAGSAHRRRRGQGTSALHKATTDLARSSREMDRKTRSLVKLATLTLAAAIVSLVVAVVAALN